MWLELRVRTNNEDLLSPQKIKFIYRVLGEHKRFILIRKLQIIPNIF